MNFALPALPALVRRAGALAAFLPALLLASPAHAAAPTAFSVDVQGKGTPMILIPGLSSAGTVWDSTVARYRDGHQLHVLWLAGFAGKAPLPAAPGSQLDKVVEELSAYISEKGLKDPVIVGHSLGGFLAMRMAIEHPQQVGKLVIVDSLPALAAMREPRMDEATIKAAAAQMRERMLNGDPAAIAEQTRATVRYMVTPQADYERVLAWGMASDRTAVANAMHDMLALDLRSRLAAVKAPTLVLAASPAGAQAMIGAVYNDQYRQLAGANIRIADNARHFIMYDAPAWMFEQIDSFLK